MPREAGRAAPLVRAAGLAGREPEEALAPPVEAPRNTRTLACSCSLALLRLCLISLCRIRTISASYWVYTLD